MKTQEAAFRQSYKPKKVKKPAPEQKAATPKGVVKNAKRNDRRKAGRAARSLAKALGVKVEEVKKEGGEVKEGEDENGNGDDGKGDVDVKMEVEVEEKKIEEESERMKLLKARDEGFVEVKKKRKGKKV